MGQPPSPGRDAYGAGRAYGGYPPPAGYGPPGYQPVDPTLAEWWQRLVARLIDNAITVVASFVLVIVLGFTVAGVAAGLSESSGADEPDDTVSAIIGIIAFVLYFAIFLGVPFLYEWLMLRSKGQTVGKMVMKIQPVNADTRQPLTNREAAKRALWYPFLTNLASAATCNIGGLLDGLWPLWDKPLAQALHDKPAHTVVIKTEIPAPYGAPYGYPPPGYPPQ